MTCDLENKIVLITGAAKGIGAAVVRELLDENVKHIAVLDVDVKSGTALQNELNAKYGKEKVKFFMCDITRDDQLFSAFKSTTEDHGYIDLVVNNAGICNESLGSYKKEIEINVTALITSTLKAIQIMSVEQGGRGGTIINVASIAALRAFPPAPVYCATKAAVLHFTCCLGDEEYYARTKVRVLTMCLGATDSTIIDTVDSFDKCLKVKLLLLLECSKYPKQSCKSAAKAFVEAYKRGGTGSVWLSANDEPVQEITDNIKKAHDCMLPLPHE